MSSNCSLVRYQISVLSNITHFKVWVKAGDNTVISPSLLYICCTYCIHACTRTCRQTLTHTSIESVSALSIIASGSPRALWLVAGWWMSLPWAALLKRLSIRLQPHGPSHLIRSQWKPVAPCHHSYSIGPEMQQRQPMEHGAWRAEEAISVQREDIMWLMYNSVSHGWRCTWLERRDSARRGALFILIKSRVLFPFFAGYFQKPKASSKILSIKLPTYSFKLHLNENEHHYSTSKNSTAFCRSLSLPPLHLPPLVFTCQWLLCKCLSLFLSPIYMSVAFAAWWRRVKMKVICSVTVRPFYQLLLSSILVSEYWWQWNQGAVKKFCKPSC